MKIHEKIIRRLKNTDGNIHNIIKKDTLRRIKKDIEIMANENITFGIEQLNISNLTDFYENIYIPVIGGKKNANIHNLLEAFPPEELSKNTRFFCFIRKGTTLLAGGIFNYIDDTLRFSYKANLEEDIPFKAGFGTLIDFRFFSFGIEKGVKSFSYGADRNGYGSLGASFGLCFHKLFFGFKPMKTLHGDMIEIDEKNITTPTIIFNNTDEHGLFQEAILLNITDNEKKYEDILVKKGFTITII